MPSPRSTRSAGCLHALGTALLLALAFAAASSARVHAQPSGGPYGPLALRYDVPAEAAHVFYAAPDGKEDAAGTSLEAPTTLGSAFARVVTGDAIILRGGVYRVGGLKLNQGITLQPYADEQPILKGTQVATQWEPVSGGLWRTKWTTLFPMKPADWWRRHRHGKETPLYRFNNDMVFVDGRFLRAVGWEGEVDAGSYCIDYEAGHVYIGVDPRDRLVEITAWDGAITRTTGTVHGKPSDRRGPTIRGLTFTQYAYRALEIEGKDPEGVSPEADHGKDVVGTTLEHVTITFCSRVAAYLRGDHLTIRHCLVSDTSTEGLYVLSSNDVLLEKNIIRRNNIEEITGYYPAAVKIFNQSHRVTCRDNLVIDHPHSSGIWYDVGNRDAVFVNNWIERTNDGFFFEISRGAICAGNVFVDCNKGIRILNAADVAVYHNTFVNSAATFERTPRSAVGDHFGWHPATGPDVDARHGHVFVGNLLVGEAAFRESLLRFEQTASLVDRLTQPQAARLDHNLYVRASRALAAGQEPRAGSSQALIVWSPARGVPEATNGSAASFPTLAAFQAQVPEFEVHSRALDERAGAIFQSAPLGRYELLPLPLLPPAAGLPAPVRTSLGWSETTEGRPPGAYPRLAGAVQ